jgi:hypothetical protein
MRPPSRTATKFSKGELIGKEKRCGAIPKNRSRSLAPLRLNHPVQQNFLNALKQKRAEWLPEVD